MCNLKTGLKVIFVLILIFSLSTCRKKEKVSFPSLNALEKIKTKGKIVAVVDFNSTNYFIYRGEPMGYQYELLKLLADHLNVKLEIVVNNVVEDCFKMLEDGKCDIIAINLAITKERSKKINFSSPHSQTRQVLIQRKPENWKKLSKKQIEKQVIRNQLELANKMVYVQRSTSFAQRMRNLSDEIGDSIRLIEVSNKEVEELIELVAVGEIDYTIADENVALVNNIYYPNLDVKTAVSFPQNLAWGLSKNEPALKNEIDNWIIQFKKKKEYAFLYNKYFKNPRSKKYIGDNYYSINKGKVSKYDNYIKKYSKTIDWDWRLLASLIYQESRFYPNVKSWAGAYGLMQLMPTTAKRFGVSKNSSPEKQIKAGVEFINWLDKRFENRGIIDEEEKIKFVLASYNVGLGHILDARRLAKKEGKNPNKWEDNVDGYIKKKSLPKYYKDPIVKYGYCRGDETYNYVYDILDRFEHYKNIIPEA